MPLVSSLPGDLGDPGGPAGPVLIHPRSVCWPAGPHPATLWPQMSGRHQAAKTALLRRRTGGRLQFGAFGLAVRGHCVLASPYFCRFLTSRFALSQENDISYVDCGNMSSLRVLQLGHNKLTSIHGLTGAVNLGLLDLSHNSITRIGENWKIPQASYEMLTLGF